MKYLEYPSYTGINKTNLNPMTIILVAGSNPLTKWFENKINHYPYRPAFTHVLIHVEDGICVDVGLTTCIKGVDDVLKKSHFYLSVELTDLTQQQIDKGQAICYKKAGGAENKFKLYDVWGFLAFGLRKLGLKVKGSEKFDFCSDMVVDTFKSMGHPLFELMQGELTSPCDLYIKIKDYTNARIRHIEVD